MMARLLCVCLVAFLIAVSVQRNPQGKHGSLSEQSSKVEAAESSASSDGDGGILPTFFPFEATRSGTRGGEHDEVLGRADTGALEVFDTEEENTPTLLSDEVLGRADTGALEVFDTEEENTPTLLSDEVLARLLQSSEEEQQAVGEDKEYEEEKEEVEAEEEKEAAKGEDQQQERVEVRSSAAVEIPVDLDYNMDSEVTDASSTKLEGRNTWTSEAEGDEKVAVELPTAMADYDSQQSTAAKNRKEGSKEADQAVSTEVSEDEQEQRLWNTVKDKRSQPAEEEEGTSARRRRAKGRRRKTQHMKNVQNLQSGQTSKGRARTRTREREPNNNFPMMHHAKIPMLDLKPEQFLATADLNPRTRTTVRVRPGTGWQEATADSCQNFPCKRGKACELNDEMEPHCVCQQLSHCPSANFPELQQVCGTDNQTYETSCQLFATKCYLEGTKKGHSLHLDYTGPCKLILPCLHMELLQFPLRMRDWLKNVLLQLYEHDSITPGLLTDKQRVRVQKLHQSTRHLHAGDHPPIELLALDFEKNYKLYIYPVHWQFAQLDKDPMDRLLSHSELAPLRAPLVPMEHCTSVFFAACDTDRDGLLSLSEWCQCLGLQHEDMDVHLLF